LRSANDDEIPADGTGDTDRWLTERRREGLVALSPFLFLAVESSEAALWSTFPPQHLVRGDHQQRFERCMLSSHHRPPNQKCRWEKWQ
jgi:hypothetical protein